MPFGPRKKECHRLHNARRGPHCVRPGGHTGVNGGHTVRAAGCLVRRSLPPSLHFHSCPPSADPFPPGLLLHPLPMAGSRNRSVLGRKFLPRSIPSPSRHFLFLQRSLPPSFLIPFLPSLPRWTKVFTNNAPPLSPSLYLFSTIPFPFLPLPLIPSLPRSLLPLLTPQSPSDGRFMKSLFTWTKL